MQTMMQATKYRISLVGADLSITSGSTVGIGVLQDGVDDADNSPTNEIQNLFIDGDTLEIAGGEPGMEVSWQVTGIRHDKYAEKNPIKVEVDKSSEEKGLYLHPEAFGQPKEKGNDYKMKK